MSNYTQSWSLIIFCYNEEGNLPDLLDKTVNVLNNISNGQHEIILIDDGSTDKTLAIAQEATNRIPYLKIKAHQTNLGIGAALKAGYALAQYENICAIPGDGQFDVKELEAFPMVDEGICVSFFRKENLQYSVWRESLSWFNRKFNEWFLGVKLYDVNWVKIYKKTDLDKITLNLESSLVESEICAKLTALGTKFITTPSKYLERGYGKDKGASLKIVSQAFLDVIALLLETYKFRKSLK